MFRSAGEPKSRTACDLQFYFLPGVFFFLNVMRRITQHSNQSFFFLPSSICSCLKQLHPGRRAVMKTRSWTPSAIQVRHAIHITVSYVRQLWAHTRRCARRRTTLQITALSHRSIYLEFISLVRAWCHFWRATVIPAGVMQGTAIACLLRCCQGLCFCDRMPRS